MKKQLILLAFVVCAFSALPALAQKKGGATDSTKSVCRLWIIDRKAMETQFKGKEEFAYMQKDIERQDIYLNFKTDGTVMSNQGSRDKKDEWSFSPDKKVLIVGGTELWIKELSAKRLAFTARNRDGLVFYLMSPKKGYKLRVSDNKEEKLSEPAVEPKKED